MVTDPNVHRNTEGRQNTANNTCKYVNDRYHAVHSIVFE